MHIEICLRTKKREPFSKMENKWIRKFAAIKESICWLVAGKSSDLKSKSHKLGPRIKPPTKLKVTFEEVNYGDMIIIGNDYY